MGKKYWLRNLLYVCLFAAAIALRLINLSFPFGDYDEGVYLATTRSLLHGFPLLTQTYISQCPLLIDLAFPLYIIHPALWVMRLIPVICSLGTILIIFAMLWRFSGKKGALFTATYLTFNSIFLIVSRTFQMDVPWVFLTTLTFFLLLIFDRTKQDRYIIGAGVAFMASVLMKANITFVAVLAVYLVYLYAEEKQKAFRYLAEFVGTALLFFLLVIHPSEIPLLYHQALAVRTGGLGAEGLLSSTRMLLLKHEVWILLMMIACLAYMLLRIVMHGAVALHDKFRVLSGVWVMVTILLLSVYNPLFPHHLVFLIVPATLFVAGFVDSIFAYIPGWGKVVLSFFLFFVVCYAAWEGTSDIQVVFPKMNQYDLKLQDAANYVSQHTTKDAYVVADDQLLLYLADRNTPPDLVDTSFVRIQTKLLTTAMLRRDINTFHPTTVAVISGRFMQLPDFITYLKANFTEQDVDGAMIFTRR